MPDMPHNTRAVEPLFAVPADPCPAIAAGRHEPNQTDGRCRYCGVVLNHLAPPPHDAGAGETGSSLARLNAALRRAADSAHRETSARAEVQRLQFELDEVRESLARSERAREELQKDKEQLDRAHKVAIAEAQDQWLARKRLAQRANLMPCPECRGAGEHLDFFRSGQSCASCRGACYVPFDERAFNEVFWEPYSSAPSTPGEEKAG